MANLKSIDNGELVGPRYLPDLVTIRDRNRMGRMRSPGFILTCGLCNSVDCCYLLSHLSHGSMLYIQHDIIH